MATAQTRSSFARKAFPVIGDVDGDGALEIVVPTGTPTPPYTHQILIVSADGTVERSITTPSSSHGNAPALADLDGDGFPEIVLQTRQALHVWRGDGSLFPGWPRSTSSNDSLGTLLPSSET